MQFVWLITIVLIILCYNKSEKYVYTGSSQLHDYKQMTHLPWCDNPISTLTPCNGLRRYYPGQRFPTGSCPPNKVSIYETGNPNTISTWKLGKEINPVYR